MEPERLLNNLEVRLGDLNLRKKKLNRIIHPPKIVAGILGAVLAEFLAWLAFDNKNGGLAIFIGIYGLMLGIGGALAIVDTIAGWLGFPKEEFNGLDSQISRLFQDIQKVKRFIWAIDDIKRLQEEATPAQNITLNAHIERLKHAATDDSFILSYDSSTFEHIRRSVGAIRGYINRGNQSGAKAPPTETPSNKIVSTVSPTEKKPPLPAIEPAIPPLDSENKTLSTGNSIPPATKPEMPPAKKQPPEAPKAQPVVIAPKPTVSSPLSRPQKPEKIYAEAPVPMSTELDISTVFSPRAASIIKKIVRIRRLRPTINGMVNYLELYISNRDIGQQGEAFVLNYEREYLVKNNRKDLADQVKRISLEDDSLGYDILSFDLTGAKKYIEVKTTNAGYQSQFFLSINETQVMAILTNYYIYRVYNFDRKSQTGLIYKIDCARDFDKYFRLETAVYKVVPNIGK